MFSLAAVLAMPLLVDPLELERQSLKLLRPQVELRLPKNPTADEMQKYAKYSQQRLVEDRKYNKALEEYTDKVQQRAAEFLKKHQEKLNGEKQEKEKKDKN